MTLFLRRSVFAFVLGAAVAAAVLVGRSAFATTDTINACFKPSNGTLYLLGTGRSDCQPGDIPINWNTSGVNGQDGVSVTSQALAPGEDDACPNGGSKFTAANNAVSYACNGTDGTDGTNGTKGTNGTNGTNGVSVTNLVLAPGDDPACPNGGTKFIAANGTSYACNGSNGTDGQNGQSFNGTFTSPNGLFRLVVDNTQAKLEGPNSRVQITTGAIQVQTTGQLAAQGGPLTTIGGGQIWLNGTTCGLFRPVDFAPAVGPGGGPILVNPTGSPTVRFAC